MSRLATLRHRSIVSAVRDYIRSKTKIFDMIDGSDKPTIEIPSIETFCKDELKTPRIDSPISYTEDSSDFSSDSFDTGFPEEELETRISHSISMRECKIKIPTSDDEFLEMDTESKALFLEDLTEQMKIVKELAHLSAISYNKETHCSKFPGWEMIIDSDTDDLGSYSLSKKAAGFYAQVWINEGKNLIVISVAGTKINHFWQYKDCGILNGFGASRLVCDLMSDYEILSKKIPWQYKAGMEIFVENLVEHMPEIFKDKEVITTGHSLGGAIATATVAGAIPHKEIMGDVSSIVFDSPGCAYFIKMILDNLRKYDIISEKITSEELSKRIVTVIAEDNLVNSTGEHIGSVIVDQNNRQELDVDYLKPYLPSSIIKVIKKLGDTYISHQKELFEDLTKIMHRSPDDHRSDMFHHFLLETYNELEEDMPWLIKPSTLGNALASAYRVAESTSKTIYSAQTYASWGMQKATDVFSLLNSYLGFGIDYALLSVMGEGIAGGEHYTLDEHRDEYHADIFDPF